MKASDPYTARFPNLAGTRRSYAGMLAAMNDAAGCVLTKVRELRQEENTLIFFYSDKGGPTPQTTSRNDPLRGYKGQLFEGGIRVPFLAQWKGKLPAGRTHTQPVMAFDIHATALVAAGGKLPTDRPLDGVDLMPFLLGDKSGPPHDQLFWRAGRQKAARVGDWKLVDPRTGALMLFNLRDDIGEQHDLAAANPAKLKELQAAYAAWDRQMMPAQWVRQDARTQGAGKATAHGAPRGGGIETRFQQLDRDGYGKVTRVEVEMFPELKGTFDYCVINRDGWVSQEEMAAVMAWWRQQRAQRNEPPATNTPPERLTTTAPKKPAPKRPTTVDTISPQFRGPRGDGVAHGTNLPVTWSTTSDAVWSCAIPGKGWSSPTIWGERVFVTSAVGVARVEAPTEKLGSIAEHVRGITTTDEHQYLLHCVDWRTLTKLYRIASITETKNHDQTPRTTPLAVRS
jgi:hypothetical protein